MLGPALLSRESTDLVLGPALVSRESIDLEMGVIRPQSPAPPLPGVIEQGPGRS